MDEWVMLELSSEAPSKVMRIISDKDVVIEDVAATKEECTESLSSSKGVEKHEELKPAQLEEQEEFAPDDEGTPDRNPNLDDLADLEHVEEDEEDGTRDEQFEVVSRHYQSVVNSTTLSEVDYLRAEVEYLRTRLRVAEMQLGQANALRRAAEERAERAERQLLQVVAVDQRRREVRNEIIVHGDRARQVDRQLQVAQKQEVRKKKRNSNPKKQKQNQKNKKHNKREQFLQSNHRSACVAARHV